MTYTNRVPLTPYTNFTTFQSNIYLLGLKGVELTGIKGLQWVSCEKYNTTHTQSDEWAKIIHDPNNSSKLLSDKINNIPDIQRIFQRKDYHLGLQSYFSSTFSNIACDEQFQILKKQFLENCEQTTFFVRLIYTAFVISTGFAACLILERWLENQRLA